MSFLNANFGPFEWWCDNRFIFNSTGVSACLVFGVSSRVGKPLEFHIMLQSGAVYWRVPIHALRTWPNELDHQIQRAMIWDCFSETFEVTTFDWLTSAVAVIDNGLLCHYITTIDWTASTIADQAGEVGHKCAHILTDGEGKIYALPNNKIVWQARPWANATLDKIPVQRSREWSVERSNNALDLLRRFQAPAQSENSTKEPNNNASSVIDEASRNHVESSESLINEGDNSQDTAPNA